MHENCINNLFVYFANVVSKTSLKILFYHTNLFDMFDKKFKKINFSRIKQHIKKNAYFLNVSY